jgi:UV DNA damage endonuclease
MELGYACICTTLQKQKITTNRGMIKKTFMSKGLDYASELSLLNVQDLEKVIQWNIDNDIKVFRITSNLFPWMSEYELTSLKDWSIIQKIFKRIGKKVLDSKMRVGFHPGPFNILCSPKKEVVDKTIKELDQHSFILDTMGLPISNKYKVNIHIGGAYGDKHSAMDRWIENFQLLSNSTKKRLTLENDDKPNMYNVQDLLYIHEKTNTSIVFDFHHYDCNPGNLSKKESLELALCTWGDVKPMTHFSSSRKKYEDSSCKVVAHADYLYDEIPTFGYDFDVVVEAKAKEQAVIHYLEKYH